MRRGCLVAFGLFLTVATFSTAFAQQNQRAEILKKYLAPRTITILEWELVQFNLLWQGSYAGENYLTSFPVQFDPRSSKFRSIFRVQEKRDAIDPQPFFSLPRPQRESILKGAVDFLLDLLTASFPEVKTTPSLLYVEFRFRSPGGGFSNVAVYDGGRITLLE